MLVDDCVEKTGRLSVKKNCPEICRGFKLVYPQTSPHGGGSLSRFYELQNYAKRIKFSEFFEFRWK